MKKKFLPLHKPCQNYKVGGGFHDIVANMLDYDIVVNKSELQ